MAILSPASRPGSLTWHARHVRLVWAASGSCPRPSAIPGWAEKRLQAPFCCACTRLFEFLLYLQALFCCTYRRLFAVPARAFGHGSAALAFTHENENKREEHGSPESSRPRRAARRRPTSRPFQLAAPGDGGHGWPVPYPYARAGQAPADLRQSWPTGRTWPLASALARPSVPDLDVRAPSDEPSRWTLG